MKKLTAIPFWLRAVVVMVILTVALSVMIFERLNILTNGTEVVLKTKPVDPRDLLKGHYARLSFDISETDKPSHLKKEKFEKGDKVYLRLIKTESNYWIIKEVFKSFPQQQSEGVVIQGTIKYAYSNKLRIRYGIERYYAPKAEALNLEKLSRDKIEIGIIVRISKNGQAAISGLKIGDKKIYDEPLF